MAGKVMEFPALSAVPAVDGRQVRLMLGDNTEIAVFKAPASSTPDTWFQVTETHNDATGVQAIYAKSQGMEGSRASRSKGSGSRPSRIGRTRTGRSPFGSGAPGRSAW